MEKGIVVYHSKYGHTEQYARWISESLGLPLVKASEVSANTLSQYHVIVYGGGLYAGGIDGISLITKSFAGFSKSRIAVFTVGLADPAIPEQFEGILKRNFSPEIRAKIRIFHLRGGIDYATLGPVHRVMMKMMFSHIRSKPQESRTEEDRAFLETYGAKVDFTNRESAAPLIEYVQSLL